MFIAGLGFFCLFFGYYMLRPMREEWGINFGADLLPKLWLGTFLATLVLTTAVGFVVKGLPRRVFIPWFHHFFAVVFLGLFIANRVTEENFTLAATFYITLSAFNVFVVSVFWSLLSDLFKREQGDRLFGLIAVGATLGGIAGSAFVDFAASTEVFAPRNLMVLAIVLIELAGICAWRLARTHDSAAGDGGDTADRGVGGAWYAGFRDVLRSPYLAAIVGYLLVITVIASVAYFVQGHVIETFIVKPDPEAGLSEEAFDAANMAARNQRLAVFARIDLWTNIVTLLFQVLLVRQIVKRTKAGAGVALAILPLVAVVGFSVLAFGFGDAPTGPTDPNAVLPAALWTLILVQVALRSSRYGLAKPAREMLFTVLPREQKYKAKNFIDTAVYRGGDLGVAVGFDLLRGAGVTVAAITLATAPIGLIGVGLAAWLGLAHRRATPADGAPDANEKTDPTSASDRSS